jgi:hypothetical protein
LKEDHSSRRQNSIEREDLVEDIIGEIGRSDSLEFRNGELQIQNPADLQPMRLFLNRPKIGKI